MKSFFENSSRDERISSQYTMMYIYRVFRLLIILVIITYFQGCFWFLISNEIDRSDHNFVKNFELDQATNARKLIVSCYFTLTTLSTVGYGDFYPQSTLERIVGIIVLLLGVAFFSYTMGTFIEIITNYDQKMGVIDRGTDLHNWMTILSRYTNNKPLPRKLINKIEANFAYYQANDRINTLHPDDEYLSQMPRYIKRTIMRNYIFQDVFFKFKSFFNT